MWGSYPNAPERGESNSIIKAVGDTTVYLITKVVDGEKLIMREHECYDEAWWDANLAEGETVEEEGEEEYFDCAA